MTDVLTPEQRHRCMSQIRNKNTKPEWIVRRYLYSRGYRYRKNVKELPGSPDIVLQKYGIVIFIHGCFWHGHSIDGHIPHTNSDFWRRKIGLNQRRDIQNKKKLLNMGWAVITIWECQLKKAVREQTFQNLEYYLNKTLLSHIKRKSTKLYIPKTDEEYDITYLAEDSQEYDVYNLENESE